MSLPWPDWTEQQWRDADIPPAPPMREFVGARFVWHGFPVTRAQVPGKPTMAQVLKGGPGSGRYPKGSGGEAEAVGETVRLFRGDSKSVSPSLSYSDPAALFGAGIYLTDSKRIAGDYKAKGKTDDVVFRYGAGTKGTKQDAIDAYVRYLATTVDDQGKKLTWPESLHANVDNPSRIARLKQGQKLWDELAKSVEIRKLADGDVVIQKKGRTGSLSTYEVPKAWIAKTLDAEEEIPKDVAAVLSDVIRTVNEGYRSKQGDDVYNFAMTKNEDGYRPSYREVYRETIGMIGSSGYNLHEEKGQLALRKGLKELGYKGIRYAGGVTMGGARHNAYVFWDEQGLKKSLSSKKRDLVAVLKGGPGSGRYPKGSGGVAFAETGQTSSPEFKSWFGKSKVVDESGHPKVMYHETRADIESFHPFTHFGTMQAASEHSASASEFYNETLHNAERDKGANIMPVFLSIQNPLRLPDLATVDQTGRDLEEVQAEFDKKTPEEQDYIHEHGDGEPRGRAWEGEGDLISTLHEKDLITTDEFWEHQYDSSEDAFKLLQEKGYDGIVYENAIEDPGHDSWIIFDPTQVKSAIGNKGTFDPKSVLITKGGPGSGRYPKGSTGWHLTSDPHFVPNPNAEANLNSIAGDLITDKPKGLFVGDPEFWMHAHGYERPYVAQVAGTVTNPPGTIMYPGKGPFGPKEEFMQGAMTTLRVLPIDEYAREVYHDKGWVEDYFGEGPKSIPKDYVGRSVDTMSPAEIKEWERKFAEYAQRPDGPHPKEAVQKGGPGSGRYPKGSGVQSIADGPEVNRPASWGTTSHDMKLEPLPATLGEAEDRIRSQPNEHAFIFKDGKPLMVLGNDDSHHVLAPETLDLKDDILTHNHPSNYGLSNQDGVTAAARNLLEMRAVTDTGTYSIRRTGETWPKDFYEEIQKVHNDVMYEMALRLRGEWSDHEGKITIQQANSQHHDQVYKRLQESIGGFTYSFEPKVADVPKVEVPVVKAEKKVKIIRDIIRDERGLITRVIEHTVEE